MNKLNLLFGLVLTLGMASFFGCNTDDDIVSMTECDNFAAEITIDPDSTLTVTLTGGTAPYTYLWGNGETTGTINYTGFATYDVIVTDANDCMTEATITFEACTLQSSGIIVEENTDGTYTLTAGASGGTEPYSYNWSGGGTSNPIVVNTNGNNTSNFTLYITDADNCIVYASTSIVNSDSCSLNVQIVVDSTAENNILAIVSGGSGPYTYAWSDGSTGASIANPAEATSYTVTVTDSANCTGVSNFTTAGDLPCSSLMTTINVYPDSVGMNIVTLVAYTNGGTAPYAYQWSQGSNTQSIDLTSSDTGTYSVTTTDANGCVAEDDVTL